MIEALQSSGAIGATTAVLVKGAVLVIVFVLVMGCAWAANGGSWRMK